MAKLINLLANNFYLYIIVYYFIKINKCKIKKILQMMIIKK